MFEVDDALLDTIGNSFFIPPKPEILTQLQAALQEPEPDLSTVADIISQDITVSAAVLKVINSPAFGLTRKVSDIKQSTMFLGLGGVNSLVTALVLKLAFKPEDCPIPLESFWDKATHIAETAMIVAQRFKSKVPMEDIYTAALFMDCGIPAMAMKFPDYRKIMQAAERLTTHTLAQVEEHKFKTNHAVVGYYICRNWNLPDNIRNFVLHHHDLKYLDQLHDSDAQVLFSAVKTAENVISRHHNLRDTSDWHHYKASAFDILGFDDDDYNDICEDVGDNLL